MDHDNKKEINALIRMMIYLKHELIRNDLIDESKHIEHAMKSIEEKYDMFKEDSTSGPDL